MHSSFLILDKRDGKQHVRYGMGTNVGGAVLPKLLRDRAENALDYKSKVAIASKLGENNEVIMSVRKHAGLFPMIGAPSSNRGYELFVLSTKVRVGTLQDDGTLTV